MGFAQLSITDIAESYEISVEAVFRLCDRYGITYKNEETCLALEDAKAIIGDIIAQQAQKPKM